MSLDLESREAFEREWKRRFQSYAEGATDEYQVSGWSEPGLRRRLNGFRELLPDIEPSGCHTALDLGTGAGTYVRLLARRGLRVVGVDYSLPSLRRAVDADGATGSRYVAGNAYGLPFRDATFDLVIMIGILQALGDARSSLREARRLLRPGGHLVVEILNAEGLPARLRLLLHPGTKEGGVRTYRRGEMVRWLRDEGYRPLRCLPIYLPPRRLPSLEPALDHVATRWFLRAMPFCSTLAAASFLILSRTEPSPA